MKKLLLLLIVFAIPFFSKAQSTEITPGSVLPQMTTSQRTGLSPVKNGMLVFDTSTQSYWYRQSGSWVELPKGGSTSNYWKLEGVGGNIIKNTNSGGFWSGNPIGLTNFSDNISNPPTAPINGDGTRLIWIPSRSAFRVGTINGSKAWDADSIGLFSFAIGYNTKALGYYSTAMGFSTTARGISSIAMGSFTTASGYASTAMGAGSKASGDYSTAMGFYTIASGFASTAFGQDTKASGTFSTAMGGFTTASGYASTAMGYGTTSSGYNSTAMGNNTTASGDYSTAIGYGSEALGESSVTIGKYIKVTQKGSMYLADAYRNNNSEIDQRITENRFYARFDNGYYIYTNGTPGDFGVFMQHNDNSWHSISDSTRKENFIVANTESVLKSVAQMRIGTWNYKGQDPAQYRHWGVMAQDFYKYFGKDKFGTIGNDKSIATADFDGVAFAAIKGLEQRTREQSTLIKEQQKIIDELLAENSKLKEKQDFFASEILLIKQQIGLNSPEDRRSEE